MEPVYIVMICSACVFAALLLIYFLYSDKAKKEAARKQEELERAYSDKNLAKMEYDVAVYDEETRKLMQHGNSQVTMDEVMSDGEESSEDEVHLAAEDALFEKMDSEGMEEITGNFKADGEDEKSS